MLDGGQQGRDIPLSGHFLRPETAEKAAKMLGISMATLYRKLEVKAQRAAEAKT